MHQYQSHISFHDFTASEIMRNQRFTENIQNCLGTWLTVLMGKTQHDQGSMPMGQESTKTRIYF